MAGRIWAEPIWRERALILGAVLLLGACGEDEVAAPDDSDARTASGEVLEGTISDEMIALDELRSQAPLIRIAPAADRTEGEGEAVESDGGEASAQGEAAAPADEDQPAATSE